MNMNVTVVEGVTVVTLAGELTGLTAPDAQQSILNAATPACKMILDLTQVGYMSTAGFRLLLIVYRTIGGSGGKAMLVGLADEIKDDLAATGFLDFYQCYDTVPEAVQALSGK